MKKPTLYSLVKGLCGLLALQCFYGFATAQTVTHSVYSIYFASDKYDLSNEATTQLDSLVKQVNRSVDYVLDISANTDADGSNTYNDVLSWNRAKATEAYLLTKGAVINKLKAKGLGEREPLFDNTTERGKAANRRVDITATLYAFDNIDQVMEAVNAKDEQHYTIDTRKDNVIKGKNGTWVNIPAYAFLLPNGKPATGSVEIELKEALNTNDIFFASLTTTSDDRLLQTGGMVCVQAKANGEKLSLNSNKSLTVSIPVTKRIDSMQLFYGERTAAGKLNWKPTGQKPKEVELNIDLTLLKKIHLPKIDKPELPAFTCIPKRPHFPVAPKRPYLPREPVEIKYTPGYFEKHFRSKEYLVNKQAALNQPYVDAYERRMEKYTEYVKKYAEDTLYYTEVTLPQYYKDSIAYMEKVGEVAGELNGYIRTYMDYAANNVLQNILNERIGKPVTASSRFIFLNRVPEYKYLDAYALTLKYLGKDAISPNRRWCPEYGAYYFNNQYYDYDVYWQSLLLRDGSLLYVNCNSFISNKIMRLADSLGITKAMNEYDRQVFEANTKAGVLQTGDVDRYVYTINRLNWINCDRFKNTPNPAWVKIKESEDAKIMIVCDDINSYLMAYKDDDYYKSPKLDASTKITIVAIKVKDGHLQMAISKGIAGNKKIYDLEYTNCTLSQLKEQLKRV